MWLGAAGGRLKGVEVLHGWGNCWTTDGTDICSGEAARHERQITARNQRCPLSEGKSEREKTSIISSLSGQCTRMHRRGGGGGMDRSNRGAVKKKNKQNMRIGMGTTTKKKDSLPPGLQDLREKTENLIGNK